MSRNTWDAYHRGFREFTEAYEALGFDEIHRDALPFLPPSPGLVLDVGAGSGRDAAWFGRRGWDVVAAEPAGNLRTEAQRLHDAPRLRWIDDRLPALTAVHRLGLSFDLVWLSGVWQHVPPEDRPRAMRKLATLLRPGGRLIITLRHGPAPSDRPMWPVSDAEVERLGLDHGLALRVATARREDTMGRPEVRWQTVILDLPDDGAGAMPLLRGVILRQEKSATYKLGLLRCVARIADVSPNVAVDAGDDVALPLGLVALYWLRLYKPLLEAGLPQLPGRSKPAFQNADFAALAGVAAFDLRPGASFASPLAAIVARSIRHCARLIAEMPARHLTYADDRPVFIATPASARVIPHGALRLDSDWLASVGTLRVPGNVWHAMRRFAAWIEPMLVAEWVRLVQGYVGLDAAAPGATLHAALRWAEPHRDTSLARKIALERIQSGERIACVWSGRPLAARSLDIDHCLPWTAWPCGDLWNLLPSSPPINQHAKREHLVSAEVLRAAKPAILDWWRSGYAEGPPAVRLRFVEEARSSLPVTRSTPGLDLDDLFDALDFRRLRLRQEADLKEWRGVSSG